MRVLSPMKGWFIIGRLTVSAGEIVQYKGALWSAAQDSAANAAQTLTMAAEPGKRHYVVAFAASITGGAAGADVTIELRDGVTVKWREVIPSAAANGTRIAVVLSDGIEMSVNTAANLVVAIGGAAVVSHANMAGYTITT